MGFLISIFRGEQSLRFTYWICYVFPALVMTLAWLILAPAILSTNSSQHHFNVLLYSFAFLLFVNTYLCGIAVIRSAWYKQKAGFWGWAATILVLFNMVIFPFQSSVS